MKKFGIIAGVAAAVPALASAAQITDIWSIFGFVKSILDTVLPLIIAIAVVYFVYGIARYVMAGDEGAKEVAKDKIIYGVIGLFVMISIWGLVNILVNTFGLDTTNRAQNVGQQLPTIPGTR